MRGALIAAGMLALAAPAAAAVADARDGGFEVRETVAVAAPPAKVFAALGHVGQWWSGQHSYSHDARNMTLELKPGGCFCERWSQGAAAHMVVTAVAADEYVRLEGALGPLASTAAVGRMTISLVPERGGTEVELVYDVGGYAKDGLKAWAGPVDSVLGEQLTRLKHFVETGRPDAGGG